MRSSEERGIHREMCALLHDGTRWLGKRKELLSDLNTFSRRFSNEGLTFLTKVLPMLGKAIDTALSGNAPFQIPSSFKRKKKSDATPKFLGSAMRLIFDDEGVLRKEVDPDLVRWIRTFTFYAYKVELPFDEEQTQSFCENFVQCDQEIGCLEIEAIDPSFRNIMRHHLVQILSDYKRGRAKDGPGISADTPRSSKRKLYVPPSKVRNHFGRDMFHQPMEYRDKEFEFNPTRFATNKDEFDFLCFLEAFGYCFMDVVSPSSRKSDPSKVIFVPKDSRGPRVIACEPCAHMYAQQSVSSGIYSAVESSPLTRGRVNFLDQTVNQKLTFDPGNATLDLKEASDRVSYDLVADLFPPHIFADMDACRTEDAVLPNGDIVTLRKFAPMGNALCFPTMALLAYSSICCAIYMHGGCLPSRQTKVYVYGDDIIVPNDYAGVAIKALNTVGLQVNTGKSFINSRFRESCGQDTFDISTVTPLRRRKLPQGSLVRGEKGSKFNVDDGGYAMHTSALMNSTLDAGFLNLAISLEDSLSKYLKSPIPFGTKESSYCCHVVSDSEVAWRLNEQLGYSRNGKLRAYVFKDSSRNTQHTPYSRLRSSFDTRVCPITGDVKPGYLEYGIRKPVLQIRSLKKWWIGSYI